MTKIEAVCFWCAVGAFAMAWLVTLSRAVFQKPAGVRPDGFIHAGVIFQACAIGVRIWESGHLPYLMAYENTLSLSLILMVSYLAAGHYSKKRGSPAGISSEFVTMFVLAAAMCLMGYGVLQDTGVEPLSPPYKSGWLYLHVFFAWLSHAAYIVATGYAVIILTRGANGDGKAAWEKLAYQWILAGFVCHTLMLAAGSLWAHYLWGSWWSWDPVETWTLFTWLFYGFYLHLRKHFNLKKEILAALAVIGLIGILITFWGIQIWVDSVHNMVYESGR